MNELTQFNYANSSLRVTTDKNGDPRFVASDVLSLLTLGRKALERLDEDEKGVSSIHTPGGMQDMSTISESGLYSLILGSRKEEAKKFKKWVTSEVLPAIRKSGSYSMSESNAHKFLSDPASMRGLLLNYTEQVIALEQKIEAQLPAVEFMEQVSDTSNFVTIPEFAKTAGSGSVRMYQLLRDHGFLNEKNIPYQKHINSGWFKTIIKVRQHPKSGADIFYSLTLISGRGAFNVTRLMQRAA